MTWDCGVTRELGEDPIVVGNWLASRNRIGQVHFRNVVMRKPRADYTEVFPDDGDNDMFEVMKLLVKNKYNRLIFPEHRAGWIPTRRYPRALAPPPPAGPMMWAIAGRCCRSPGGSCAASKPPAICTKQKAPHR